MSSANCHPHSQKTVKDVSTWVNGRMKLNTDIHLRVHVARGGQMITMSNDLISRQAMLDGLASIAKAKAKSDAQKALMGRVMFFTEHLPPVTPQPKMERSDKDVKFNRKE